MRKIPFVVRYTTNATGAITFTGNTLGLSRSTVEGVPGTLDSIGAFVTTNSAVRFGTYPLGTTNDYLSNSAAAVLTLPAGSTVLYAELIWGGSYIVGTINLSAAINNPVTFITPAGTSNVSPDSATATEVDLGGGAFGYVRSANVTALVQAGGAGTYTTGKVVGTITTTDSTINHAGWTLGVVYQNGSLPFRNMSLRAGAVLVQSTSAAVSTTLTGFATPVTGALGGRALFSAQEGDANRTGDQALFGPTAATAQALSGPNNFASNFFASQINNDAGQLSTTGTFGTRNQTNGAPGTNISGGRQGWDITNVDVSSRLVNNQSSAVLTLTTSGDAYVLNGNAIQIDINAPKIALTKSSNSTSTVIGDTITYTVTITNSGTASAASVVLSDTLPAGSTFIPGSVTVGGVTQSTANIGTGVALGSLALGASVVVTYRASVTSLPSGGQLVNQANVAFTFQSVAGGQIITGVIPSNAAATPVYSPTISIAKSADTSNATVGDTVAYTLVVSNSGSIAANVTLTEPIPAGSSFVANSLQINGTTVPGGNPAAGVSLGSVAVGGSVTVTFQTIVNTLPSPPQLINQASTAYTYQPPDGRTLSGSAVSNTLTIPVRLPSVSLTKSANLTDIAVGETLTYTLVTANTGIAAINNVQLTDSVPTGTSFVTGSVVVNGTTQTSANPATGITLGTIAAGASSTVSFQIRVNTLPSTNQISNQATAAYNSGTFSGITTSNTLTTPVFQPIVTAVKSADHTNATVGDTIVYRITVRNTGNIAAQTVVFDNIPSGTSFVSGSVQINGTASSSSNPTTGISIGSVATGGTTVVSFAVVLNSLPSPPQLVNQAVANFAYQLPSGRTLTGAVFSNTTTIPASLPNVAVTKSTNSTGVAVGDEVTYTIVAVNNGFEPVTNVVVSDPIPAGAAFVAGSTTLNGTSVNVNPSGGVPAGTLNAGAQAIVTFRVVVQSLPSPPQLSNQAAVSFNAGAFSSVSFSNTVTTPVLQPIISLVKSSRLTRVTVGDTIGYTLQVSNSGSTAAQITLFDSIPQGTSFSFNSVIINGHPTPGVDPITGIPIGTLAAGSSATVTFELIVTSIPVPQQLVNQGTANYVFSLPNGRQLSGFANSNTVTVPVSVPSISIIKSSGSIVGVSGDTVVFASVIANVGTVPVNNVVFLDDFPAGTTYIPGSVLVNGSSRSDDPSAGIPLGTLAANASVTVTYEVKINMPTVSQITNQSTVSFTSGTFSGASTSNTVAIPVTQPIIALTKAVSTKNATLGDTVTYTLTVTNTGNLPAIVTLTDTIPAGTVFATNSVVVGGNPQPNADPVTGILVGPVAAGSSVVVTFAVVVTTLPTPQQLTNQAFSSYTFTPPDNVPRSGTAASNVVTIPVSSPDVSALLTTAATAASLGDIISYSANVRNNGIGNVNSVIFFDPQTVGATFVPGSVSVNGVPQPTANPTTGIQIGTITPGDFVNVTFDLRVTSVPTPAQITNQAAVSFTAGAFTGVSYSNTVVTPIYQPVIGLVKTASQTAATVGDTITYTLNVSNTGNFSAQVFLIDTLPAGTLFQPNSVIVGTMPQPDADPLAGFSIGTVAPGATIPVRFSVVVNSLPTPQVLSNQGTANFTFTPPDSVTRTGSVVSNTVTIPVSSPNVSALLSSNVTVAAVGETIIYSTNVRNNGIAPVTSAVYSDTPPAGTSFIPGTVTVNGTSVPGANPIAGIQLGTIAPGDFVTVTYNVSVNTLPSGGQISNDASVSFTSGALSSVSFSNTVVTPIFQPLLNVFKSASTSNASVGNPVVYTITISNTGNFPANVLLTDPLPAGTTLQPNSVIVNGAAVPGGDPVAGIPVGSVAAGSTATVNFTLIVSSLPNPQQIVNLATAAFTFTLSDNITRTGSAVSNTVTIPVSSPNISVVKSASAIDAVTGDTITYTLLVTNTGIADVMNTVLTDPLPTGTVLVPGSVTVDTVGRPLDNPATGILLGTIPPTGFVTVTFRVTVA